MPNSVTRNTAQPNNAERYELLAPAGNAECARAAIANGADAIYFGLQDGLNARARAENFDLADLPELFALLHRHGVKGYVTLNTLVFPDELAAAEQIIRELAVAGTDAVLVQDLGLARLIREVAPSLPIHASTQMTMTSAENIAEIESLGIERVVLARELSLREIRLIHSRTKVPLEAFVHGALCVAYSGQCLTSESLGGRSANRGQCAQACRLPYELICDNQPVATGAQKYLLSPQDLAAYALIPELMDAGIVSFKIEGRLKTAEYVANITRHYREAIDTALSGQPVKFTPRQIEEMELSFSRGFSPGWLQGCDHKMLVPAISSAKQGVPLGTVAEVDVAENRVHLRLTGSVKPGDGLVFAGDRLAGQEQGGRVFSVRRDQQRQDGPLTGGLAWVDFYQHSVDLSQLERGQAVWKNDDPELNTRLRKSYSGTLRPPKFPISIEVRGSAHAPLQLTIDAGIRGRLELESSALLQLARKHPLTEEVLAQQLGRLGDTDYELAHVTARLEGAVMLPLSQLGELRRSLQDELNRLTPDLPRVVPPLGEPGARERLRAQVTFPTAETSSAVSDPRLIVLCRSLKQIEACLAAGVQFLYADFADIREYRTAISQARQNGAELWIATPRIQKPGEIGIFHAMAKNEPAGVLVRNLAGLAYFRKAQIPCAVDFSLNAANELTIEWLLEQQARRVTVSYDLNQDQLWSVLQAASTSLLELVIYQHMPMFHMEHCVFCAMLSPGTNKTNCGRPCDRHQVELKDRVGAVHPLLADVGCRNTLFNQTAQSGAEIVPRALELGVRNFRIELLHDPDEVSVARLVKLHAELLRGEISGETVWQELHATNRFGVTRGTLEHERNPLAIV